MRALALILLLAAPAQAASTADVYRLYCSQCHGTRGTGAGINSASLTVQPRDHTSAADMGKLSDADLLKAIRDGGVAVGKSPQMPPFGGALADGEIKALVAYLRELCRCKGL